MRWTNVNRNCDEVLGRVGGDRCPYCGQWHLREGYCQALGPKSGWHNDPAARRLAKKHGVGPPKSVSNETVLETETVNETEESVSSVSNETDGDTRSCVECGGELPSTARPSARYCSSACRLRAHRRKNA